MALVQLIVCVLGNAGDVGTALGTALLPCVSRAAADPSLRPVNQAKCYFKCQDFKEPKVEEFCERESRA